MSTPSGLLTHWADLLIESLVAGGVSHLIISPGSRSTPYLMAALRLNARGGDLRCHSILDERAAAFFALGLARREGKPAALLCTSGTAAAHYFPALIEASESALPLIVVSADRPTALSQCGAPQTMDQVHLFSRHVRFFADLGGPQESLAALRGLTRTVLQATSIALGPQPGPIHLNARASKPLEPFSSDKKADEKDLTRRVDQVRRHLSSHRASTATSIAVDTSQLEQLVHALAECKRPAFIAGPTNMAGVSSNTREVRELLFPLCRRLGAAMMAESTSQLRFTDDTFQAADVFGAFDLWLEKQPPETAPDLIVELFQSPTSAGYMRWLAQMDRVGSPPRRFVLGGSRWRDPQSTAEAVILGDTHRLLEGLAEGLDRHVAEPAPERLRWLERLRTAEEKTWDAIDSALAGSEFGEGSVTRSLLERLPEASKLCVGNSLPIRHLDRFVRPLPRSIEVYSQRGVNGIDGLIAGAAAVAMSSTDAGSKDRADDGTPTVLLIGDVSLSHDLSSLSIASRASTCFVIVLLDNGGGRIFDYLPIAKMQSTEDCWSYFETEPGIDFESAAATYGLRYRIARSDEEFAETLDEALAEPKPCLLHCRVPPRGAIAVEEQIRQALNRV